MAFWPKKAKITACDLLFFFFLISCFPQFPHPVWLRLVLGLCRVVCLHLWGPVPLKEDVDSVCVHGLCVVWRAVLQKRPL